MLLLGLFLLCILLMYLHAADICAEGTFQILGYILFSSVRVWFIFKLYQKMPLKQNPDIMLRNRLAFVLCSSHCPSMAGHYIFHHGPQFLVSGPVLVRLFCPLDTAQVIWKNVTIKLTHRLPCGAFSWWLIWLMWEDPGRYGQCRPGRLSGVLQESRLSKLQRTSQ